MKNTPNLSKDDKKSESIPQDLPFIISKRRDTLDPIPNLDKNVVLTEKQVKSKRSIKSTIQNQNDIPSVQVKDQMKPMPQTYMQSPIPPNMMGVPAPFIAVNNNRQIINESKPAITAIAPNIAINPQQFNPFIANANNMYIPPNISLAGSPMGAMGTMGAPIGNYVQIPVMIANPGQPRPANPGPIGFLDNINNMNDQFTNLNGNDGYYGGSSANMQKIYDNNIFIQQSGNNPVSPVNPLTNNNFVNGNQCNNNNFTSTYLNSFQDFENKMFNIIKNQNRTLQLIKEDNDKTHDALNKIKVELNSLKESLKNLSDQNLPSSIERKNEQNNDKSSNCENWTNDTVIKYVFNQTELKFKYELVVKNVFPKILYKERYFNFDVCLIDINTKEKVANTNKIPVDLAVYSLDDPPKMIRNNTIGNKMANWNTEQNLFEGEMHFEKVQIRDVSSHFRNGCFLLIIFPKPSQNNTFIPENIGKNINFQEIKPLVIQNIIVRAKKLKLKLKKNGILKGRKKKKIHNEELEENWDNAKIEGKIEP